MPDSEQPLAINPRVAQELKIVSEAIAVSMGVREIAADFIVRRDALIATAGEFITPPQTEEEQQEIIGVQRQLAGMRKEVEKQAAAYKAPLNAARTNIIQIEKTATETIEKAEKVLQGLVNHRQQKLLEARRAEEAKVEAERKRLADQQAQAQREQEAAERKRKEAELAEQRAQDAKGGEAKAKADSEAQALREEAERMETQALEKLLEAESADIAPAVISEQPQAREVRDFVLIGRNDSEQKASLIRLLGAHPEFFKLHAKTDGARGFSLNLMISSLVDSLNGTPPFKQIDGAPGIQVSTRLTTLR